MDLRPLKPLGAENDFDNWWLYSSDSEYARVVFFDIAEVYPTDKDIECRYQFSIWFNNQASEPGAKIGLRQIGFAFPCDNYVTYVSCTEASVHVNGGRKEYVVLFPAANLPKDNQFYQFSYLDAEGQMHGASTPFQFGRPRDGDQLQSMAPDRRHQDFIWIPSRHEVVEEKLRHTLKTTTDLKLANEDLHLKLERMLLAEKELQQEKHDRSSTIQQLESDVRHLKEAVQVLETEVKQKQVIIKEKEENCARLQSSLDGAEGRSQQLHSTIRDMAKKQGDLISRIKAEEENYTLLQEKCKQLEVKVHQADLEKKEQQANFISSSTAFEHHKFSLEGQVKALQEENKRLKDQSLQEKEQCKQLEAKVQQAEVQKKEQHDNFVSSSTVIEHHKLSLEVQMRVLQEENKKLKDQGRQEKENFEFLLSQFENTKAMLAAQEDTKKLMKRELEADKEFRNKITQLMQNVHTENFMLQEKLKASESSRFLEKEHINDLNVQVTELKKRLKEGAREYQRQYVLRSKLERKLMKIKGSNRSSLSETLQSASSDVAGMDSHHSVGITNSDADTGESCSGGNVNTESSEELKDNKVAPPDNPHISCTSETEVKEPLSCDAVPSAVVLAPSLEAQKVVEAVQTTAIRHDTSETCTVLKDYKAPSAVDANRNSSEAKASAPPLKLSKALKRNGFRHFRPPRETDDESSHLTYYSDMIAFAKDRLAWSKDEHALEDQAAFLSIYHVPCPVCDKDFVICSEDAEPLINHLQVKHSQTPCPVCSKLFDLSLPSQYLEYHVQDHFRDFDIQVTPPTI